MIHLMSHNDGYGLLRRLCVLNILSDLVSKHRCWCFAECGDLLSPGTVFSHCKLWSFEFSLGTE